MTGVQWIPGDQHALVRAGVVVLLAGEVSREDVLGIWDGLEALDVLDGLGSLLDVLSDVTGRGLRSLPDFALTVLDERGLHVAVRGSFDVEIFHLEETIDLMRGEEVSTWVERNFDAATVAEVLLGTVDRDILALPVTGGVVPAAGLRLTLASATRAPELEPNAEPDAERPAEPLSRSAPATLIEEDVEPVAETSHPSAPSPAAEPAVEVVDAASTTPSATAGRFASLLSPHTVIHDIEEAAVRPDGGTQDEPHAPPVDPEPPQMTAGVEVEVVEVSAEPEARALSVSTTSPSFISAVPASGAPSSRAPTRTQVPAAPGVVESASPGLAGELEHHDGHTAFEAPDNTMLDAYLEQSATSAAGLMVLGVCCPAGHGNPAHRTECRVCAQRLLGDSTRMPRPGLGWLHTSAGESIELVQNVLAGRDPRASRIQGTVMPRLLPLPHSHVSGTHLEIRLEGWSVLVADLRSTNGTFLQRPGQPTLRISEAPQLLLSDDIVQLGHGVDLRFEALP